MSCSLKSGSPKEPVVKKWCSYSCLDRSAHARFLWPSFLATFRIAGTVSTLLLDFTIAVRFRLTVCVRNSPKAASLAS